MAMLQFSAHFNQRGRAVGGLCKGTAEFEPVTFSRAEVDAAGG